MSSHPRTKSEWATNSFQTIVGSNKKIWSFAAGMEQWGLSEHGIYTKIILSDR